MINHWSTANLLIIAHVLSHSGTLAWKLTSSPFLFFDTSYKSWIFHSKNQPKLINLQLQWEFTYLCYRCHPGLPITNGIFHPKTNQPTVGNPIRSVSSSHGTCFTGPKVFLKRSALSSCGSSGWGISFRGW